MVYCPLKLRQSTVYTSISFLKVGSVGSPVPCLLENAPVLLSPHSLKWQLSLGHSGTLTDKPLSSTGIFLFSGQHCTMRLHPGLRGTIRTSDTLTSKQPNFFFWGVKKKSLALQAARIFGLCSLKPSGNRNERGWRVT